MKRATLTIDEAAKILGLGRNAAYEAAHRGEIPVIRIGKRMLVPKAAFEQMLGATIGGPEERPPLKGPSIKALLPQLCDVLGVTVDIAYGKQRHLVRSGILQPRPGRGPGSGIEGSPEHTAILVLALMADMCGTPLTADNPFSGQVSILSDLIAGRSTPVKSDIVIYRGQHLRLESRLTAEGIRRIFAILVASQ